MAKDENGRVILLDNVKVAVEGRDELKVAVKGRGTFMILERHEVKMNAGHSDATRILGYHDEVLGKVLSRDDGLGASIIQERLHSLARSSPLLLVRPLSAD